MYKYAFSLSLTTTEIDIIWQTPIHLLKLMAQKQTLPNFVCNRHTVQKVNITVYVDVHCYILSSVTANQWSWYGSNIFYKGHNQKLPDSEEERWNQAWTSSMLFPGPV